MTQKDIIGSNEIIQYPRKCVIRHNAQINTTNTVATDELFVKY